eukprot:3523009-Alexandrium_andersonii.AAC.1
MEEVVVAQLVLMNLPLRARSHAAATHDVVDMAQGTLGARHLPAMAHGRMRSREDSREAESSADSRQRGTRLGIAHQ